MNLARFNPSSPIKGSSSIRRRKALKAKANAEELTQLAKSFSPGDRVKLKYGGEGVVLRLSNTNVIVRVGRVEGPYSPRILIKL